MILDFLFRVICFFFTVCGPSLCTEQGSDILTTIQIIKKNGYPAEAHTVTTSDGYILELHRIPHGKDGPIGNGTNPRPPILIQHGLLSSSVDFVILSPDKGLGFVLADLGYDVWMGNVRGNVYSRAHVSLDTNDKQFWNFTWHESSIYDLPAEIDYVLEQTGKEKLIFIGHSMGTTMYFVLMSMIPEYNDKIESSLQMAPIAYLSHNKSPLLNIFYPLSDELQFVTDISTNGEFFPGSPFLKFLLRTFCELNNVAVKLCLNSVFLITGSDMQEFDKSVVDLVFTHMPAGYSVKAINHYAQLVKSGKFRQYDYGTVGNLNQYGTPEPPDYPVERITSPMYFYVGKNDYLATLVDTEKLSEDLISLKKTYVVKYPKFSHVDFIFAKDVKTLLYDEMIKDITAHFLNENKIIRT